MKTSNKNFTAQRQRQMDTVKTHVIRLLAIETLEKKDVEN